MSRRKAGAGRNIQLLGGPNLAAGARDLIAEVIAIHGDEASPSIGTHGLSLHRFEDSPPGTVFLQSRSDQHINLIVYTEPRWRPFDPPCRLNMNQADALLDDIGEAIDALGKAVTAVASRHSYSGIIDAYKQHRSAKDRIAPAAKAVAALRKFLDRADPNRRPWTAPPDKGEAIAFAVRLPVDFDIAEARP